MVAAQPRLAKVEWRQARRFVAALDERDGGGTGEPGRMAGDVITVAVRDEGVVTAARRIEGEAYLVKIHIVAEREQVATPASKLAQEYHDGQGECNSSRRGPAPYFEE